MYVVRPRQALEALAPLEFGVEIDVSLATQKLVEFLSAEPLRSFRASVQLRRAGFDGGVTDDLAFEKAAELSLKLLAIVGPDLAHPEWEFLDDMIHEVDGIRLYAPFEDFEVADAFYIVKLSKLVEVPASRHFPLSINNLKSIWM